MGIISFIFGLAVGVGFGMFVTAILVASRDEEYNEPVKNKGEEKYE